MFLCFIFVSFLGSLTPCRSLSKESLLYPLRANIQFISKRWESKIKQIGTYIYTATLVGHRCRAGVESHLLNQIFRIRYSVWNSSCFSFSCSFPTKSTKCRDISYVLCFAKTRNNNPNHTGTTIVRGLKVK